MDIRQVSHFLAVVESGSIGRAAAALGIAQPSLSQSLRALERELGTSLFHRVPQGVILTPAGRVLVGPARRLRRDVAAARDAVGHHATLTTGGLDVVATALLGGEPLPGIVGRFRERFPGVVVRLEAAANDGDLCAMVRDARADIGVGCMPVQDEELDTVELGSLDLWAVLPPGSDPGPGPLPLAYFEGRDMVGGPRGSGPRDIVERALLEAGVRARLAVEVEQREACVPLVLGNVGAAVLPRAQAEAATALGVVARPLGPSLAQPFGLVLRTGTVSPAVRSFVAMAVALLDDGPGADGAGSGAAGFDGAVGGDERPGALRSSTGAERHALQGSPSTTAEGR